jgi:hypothetical protein
MDINLQVKIKITVIFSCGFKRCLQNFSEIFSPNFRLSLLCALTSHANISTTLYNKSSLSAYLLDWRCKVFDGN